MKTLLILRHGKAESYNDRGDKVRILTDRGIGDAKQMGALIAERIGNIDTVVSSTATRALMTARLTADAAGYEGALIEKPQIYGATVDTLLDVVRALPSENQVALIVGHNPGFEELCSVLTGQSPATCRLPTCGLAHVVLTGSWSDADAGSAALDALWTPKDR